MHAIEKTALMKLVEDVKWHSSKWVKTLDESPSNFYWQDGYAAFSVTPGEATALINYIGNQHERHVRKSYQDEYRAFLKEYEVEYDEQYVRD